MTDSAVSGDRCLLSLVVLAWNNIDLTTRCVESLRRHTAVDYELIVVDNGSDDGTAEYARSEADIAVVNDDNRGFAAGMNQGLARASGEFVAFINNDTEFPENWAAPLLEDFESQPRAGIVLPAVTTAGNPVTVREQPGDDVIVLLPFGEFPSGVVYVMRSEHIRALGGWAEEYKTASAEDLDLAFTVWAHGLDVLLDERVLVHHEGQASVKNLSNRKTLYRENLEQFLDRWEAAPLPHPLIDTVDPIVLTANQERARTAIAWIRRMLAARDQAAEERARARTASTRESKRRRWFRARS